MATPSRRPPWSIRAHLAAFAAALALPILAFVGLLLWQYGVGERARLEGAALAEASDVARAIDGELGDLLSSARILALTPAVRNGRLEDVHRLTQDVHRALGIITVLRRPDGQQLVNPLAAFGAALPRVVLPTDGAVLETRRPQVSDLFLGGVSRAPLFAVTVPVLEEGGEVAYLLNLSLPVERLRALVQREAPPVSWVVAVVDRAGTIMARNIRHEDFVGRPATRDLQENTRDREGTWNGFSADGRAVFGAYQRSTLADWRVAVGVGREDLSAPLRRSLAWFAWIGAGVLAAAALLAALFGQRITAPIAALAERAAAVGRGEAVAPVDTAVGEVARVGGALAAASQELRRRETALRESEERYRAIVEVSPLVVWTADAAGRLTFTNQVWHAFSGLTPEETNGTGWIGAVHPDDRERVAAQWERSIATGADYETEYRLRAAAGSHRWFLVRAKPVRDAAGAILRWTGTAADIEEIVAAREVLVDARARAERLVAERTRELAETNRRLTEEARQRADAEAQLRQAQKMEAVGRLTGGVAHDFNNLLTVVVGNLEMMQRRLADDPRLRRHVDNAMEGARRAATLTQRLLAFSRQSPLSPEPVSPNKLVGGMSDLLQRTLGEAVAVETVLAGGLWRTLADPNGLESALLNLAVNARDAMPEGGKLTIETANTHLDEAYAASRDEVKPGQYVMIAVADTGAGMAPDVVARAFDPFFTTKPVGKGTGLGLSQVYGFAKQSGGHVSIYSEVGQGTTVKLYLPRLAAAEEAEARGPAAPEPVPATGRGETVLVVEDEAMVRDFTVAALEEAGYRVLAAEDGPAALALLDRHPEIALLFTDVVLTGPMNGRKVADEALRRRPGLPVLFTTGYTRNAIIHHGRLDSGVNLLGKPFTAAALARRIHDLLEGAGREG